MRRERDSKAEPEPAEVDTRSVIVERELSHPPEKVWRALTQPHLIEEWLAKTGFRPETGHRFSVQIGPQPNRRFAFECEVLTTEPHRRLTYTWDSIDDETGNGLKSIVSWHLTAIPTGTRLRMEQTGFKPDQPNYFHGARLGWPAMIAKLEQTLDPCQ